MNRILCWVLAIPVQLRLSDNIIQGVSCIVSLSASVTRYSSGCRRSICWSCRVQGRFKRHQVGWLWIV